MKANLLGKQRQLAQNKELTTSFKNTSNLAHALTKERVQIQNDLQKISAGKEQLEALKNMKKVAEPILTAEEKSSKINKAEIKGTGFQMQMISSEKGRVMIEAQRDSRRQRHIAAVNESHKFIDQFYDNFCERKNEIKERSRIFVAASDQEIEEIMSGLTDEMLLENEIAYVNTIWDKVSQHRSARNADSEQLRANLDQLKTFQQKGSTGFLNKLRDDLINIAFLLEPQVDDLLVEYRVKDEKRYEQEHTELDTFHEEVVHADAAKFEVLYATWKAAVVQFHKLKQADAIKKFLDRMNSEEFVNPPSRVAIYEEMREEQMVLFKQRMSVVSAIDTCPQTEFTKKFVETKEEELKNFNDESGVIFDRLADKLAKDMENTNEDVDIAEFDLKDFLVKNDAQLEENQTFDLIMEDQVTPTTIRRKLESKTLNTNAINYMDESIYKMGEICNNVINFYKDFATRMDKNKQKLKMTEVNFQVSLAQCGDTLDELVSNQEDELEVKVTEMKQAIHHVQLNEKLQECFDLLDQIQKSFRNYNVDYIKILNSHPDTMNDFYNDFEADVAGSYLLFKEERKEEIEEKLRLETEKKQEKLQAQALAKYEAEQAAEEAKRAAEEAKTGKPAGKQKAPPAKKGGKEAQGPDLDVEQLEVPKVTEFKSEMGNSYIRERLLEEIIQNLMTPQEEEEEEKKDEQPDEAAEALNASQIPVEDPKASKLSSKKGSTAAIKDTKDTKAGGKGAPVVEVDATIDNEEEEEEVKEEPIRFLPNDYMEKAEMSPPKDPYGEDTMHPDLIIPQERLLKVVHDSLLKTLNWLLYEKINYGHKVQSDIKEQQDKSVEELDQNLRKQWPRKGRLEVEIFQERKSQITKHNKQYERHVRTCLEKYNLLQEEWALALETIGAEFKVFKERHVKLKEMLPSGKNLAELQGMSRREKDANQTFEDKCGEFHDKLLDLGEFQLDHLVMQNADMLKNCRLFGTHDGDYARAEVAWYKEQMDEIDQLLIDAKGSKKTEIEGVLEDMKALQNDPTAEFLQEYGSSIQQLSAKEGLGKTYGQPRRLTQERMRAEMTKCEQAQKGVDQLIDSLEDLCEEATDDNLTQNKASIGKDEKTNSIAMRVTLVQAIRSIRHYALHLGGFKEEIKELERVAYTEDTESIEVDEEDKEADLRRQDEELEVLGPIGFKNASEPYVRFPEAIVKIETMCKDLCQKLYQGDNVKYLEGPDRIPAYLSVFLANMKKQAEGFKIQQVRQLRTSAQRLQELCEQIPRCAYHYIRVRYTSIIDEKVTKEDRQFDKAKEVDAAKKAEHLRLFRPNLENPANKADTQALNAKEQERSEAYIDMIDDTQMELLEIEQDLSTRFNTSFLNNTRAMVKLFDAIIYKEHFIMLPGDEIVEKKHKNIKHLTAMDKNTDLSKRATRKFPGLGPSIFKVDFEKQFEAYKSIDQSLGSASALSRPESSKSKIEEEDFDKNELSAEVEIQNTLHHKAVVRARNDNYLDFKHRFQGSLDHIMTKFDSERKEEVRFQQYWGENLKEITVKHI